MQWRRIIIGLPNSHLGFSNFEKKTTWQTFQITFFIFFFKFSFRKKRNLCYRTHQDEQTSFDNFRLTYQTMADLYNISFFGIGTGQIPTMEKCLPICNSNAYLSMFRSSHTKLMAIIGFLSSNCMCLMPFCWHLWNWNFDLFDLTLT